jgi:hypothetical protein
MILLFSERSDYTTKLVAEWLYRYQKEFWVSYLDDEATHIRIISPDLSTLVQQIYFGQYLCNFFGKFSFYNHLF